MSKKQGKEPRVSEHSTPQRKEKRRKNNNKKRTKKKKQRKKKKRRNETQLQRTDQEMHPSIQYRISQLWRAYIIPWMYYGALLLYWNARCRIQTILRRAPYVENPDILNTT